MGGGVVFQLGGASFLKGVRHGASILMGGEGGSKKIIGCPPCHARPPPLCETLKLVYNRQN